MARLSNEGSREKLTGTGKTSSERVTEWEVKRRAVDNPPHAAQQEKLTLAPQKIS
jgi:hypothetical protein